MKPQGVESLNRPSVKWETKIMNQQNDNSTSRRDFIKASSTAVVGGALAAEITFPYVAKAAPNSNKLRIGFIGCGGRGTGAASQALKADSNVVLHAVGDIYESQINKSLSSVQTDVKDDSKFDVPASRRFVGLDAYEKVLK